jgi:hypothetical protein
MAGLCTPLPTLHCRPCGRQRTARGRCGSLLLHRNGLSPSTPCRSPGAHPTYELLQGFGGSLGANAALPVASPPPELWVASSSQSCRIPYSSSGVLYSSGAASNFSPLAVRVPSLYPPVICPSGVVAIFLSSPLCKNISLHPSGKSSLQLRAIPSHYRGVSRSSRTRDGMRWARQRQA